MISVFEVLADPGRREILRLLLDGERSVGSLVAALPLAQPNVSKHLKVLREAGFVDVRPSARERLYRLRPEPLQQLDAWLGPFRATWNARSTRSMHTSIPWRTDRVPPSTPRRRHA